MARKITLFELHFDGARFGPSFGSESEADQHGETVDVEGEEADYESSGGSKLRPLLVLGGMVLLVMAVRRLRSRGEGEDYDIPLGEGESESVTAEQ